jgi:ADP-ribosylglycohydrolase
MEANYILGTIFGGAYADALGKACEFMSKEDSRMYYKEGLCFENIVQDQHRISWDKTDWTDDTDHGILLMQAIYESNTPEEAVKIFARKLYTWLFNGFPELGDTGGVGLGRNVAWVLRHEKFLDDPYFASRDVWVYSSGFSHEDGAIMRCAMAATFNKPKDEIIEYTISLCKVTHYDPRCVAGCTYIVSCIYDFIRGEKDINSVMNIAERIALDVIGKIDYVDDTVDYSLDDYITKFKKYIKRGKEEDIENINFCKGSSRSHNKYPLYCGIYAMKQLLKGVGYKEIIDTIILQGGDADTNACVAGSIVGSYLGYNRLPTDVLKLKHHTWLLRQISKQILNKW